MKTKRKWSKEEAEERLKPLSDKHQRIYYVYVCKVDGVPKYMACLTKQRHTSYT